LRMLGRWGVREGSSSEEFFSMCDYSLQHVRSRAAQVGDKLTTRDFGTGTRGFSAPEDPTTAVCVLPGTEIAFSEEIALTPAIGLRSQVQKTPFKTAVFRQINVHNPRLHHDALEFPDGRMVLLTELCEGQSAVVLQLPAHPRTQAEIVAQKRVEYIG
jgi:hypothetical protein